MVRKNKWVFGVFALSAVTNFTALAVNLWSIAKAERVVKKYEKAMILAREYDR
jgi:hypothetical protein